MPEAGGAERDVRLYTAEEVAALLRVHPSLVRELARRGEIPCKRIGRLLRFPRERIEEWLTTPDPTPRRGMLPAVPVQPRRGRRRY